MDTYRAQVIASSPIMVNVTHNGTPVYIQRVDEDTGIARIFPLGRTEEEIEVHVSNLDENGALH